MNEEKLKLLREEGVRLRTEVRKQVTGYILAGLGVVAGLAWNEAIKSAIDYIYPASGNGLRAKFLYAVVITLVIVIVSMYLLKTQKQDEKK